MLRAELDKAKASDLLIPQVVWGYFPANSDGDDLVIYRTSHVPKNGSDSTSRARAKSHGSASPTSSGRSASPTGRRSIW